MSIEKLKELLEAHQVNQTQLARLLGRDKAVITNLLQGRRQLKAEEAVVIARHFGVSVSELLEDAPPPALAEPALIPFQHAPQKKLQAASHVLCRDGRYFLVEESAAAHPKRYALEVSDDSMNLAGYLPGDIVLSDMDQPVQGGQIVVAQHYRGNGARTLLRLYQPPFLLPRSTNLEHVPLHLERDDVRVVSPVIKMIRVPL